VEPLHEEPEPTTAKPSDRPRRTFGWKEYALLVVVLLGVVIFRKSHTAGQGRLQLAPTAVVLDRAQKAAPLSGSSVPGVPAGESASGSRAELALWQSHRQRANEPKATAEIRLAAARFAIDRFRTEGDPRVLGEAQVWLDQVAKTEPVAVRVQALTLRATCEQSLHRFGAALALLEEATALDPAYDQAWLLQASILTLQGKYEEARASCKKLSDTIELRYRALCHESIYAMQGKATDAFTRLSAVVEAARIANTGEKAYFLGTLGELAQRSAHAPGNDARGLRLIEQSLTLNPRDPYVLCLWADTFLQAAPVVDVLSSASLAPDAERLTEMNRIAQRLASQRDHDAVLLRLALAEQAQSKLSKDNPTTNYREELRTRFLVAKRRGERVHLREEAWFALDVERDVAMALTLAKENFAVQKEVTDAWLLFRAAKTAGKVEEASSAADWLQRSQCEDPRLEPWRKTP
jgi:tetratricopeptide (TPR) repeat protein